MRDARWFQELDLIVGVLATATALWSLGAVAEGSELCVLLFAVNAAMAHQAWLDYARRVAPHDDDIDEDEADEPAAPVPAPIPVAPRIADARLRIDGVSPMATLPPDLLHAAGLRRAGVLDLAQAAGFARREDASAELRRLMDRCRHDGDYRGAEFAQFHAGLRELRQDEAVFFAVVEPVEHPAVVCFIGKRAC